ncbi:stage III sporulation protein AE [Lachnoclostridium phytofermentans]|uniref:Sporulation stage III, protein AE n=1 Tax=Lachnoclostridium phytofermentans (strain ATCC 700394 / DSM 18823 / ISDg) TaxID=357809 RepID=A9KMC7_LACP7|nr:stage III sporulation protein AE [Lachnoclostridium phytofermentans]ABX42881.1 sporulation stage III, protein AE [Lachnoclostridium phytofermentans ISDg]
MIRKRTWILRLIFISILLVLIGKPSASYAMSTQEEEYDYTQIQKSLNSALGKEDNMNFGEYVKNLLSGKESFSFKGVFQKMLQTIGLEFKSNLSSLMKLLTIAVISAVFTNFSHTFQNSQIAETGFYVTYLLMFVILASTFIGATKLATDTLHNVLNFMKALVPTYCMSVAFCTGATTSAAYYQGILILVTVVDYLLLKIVFPLTSIYMMAVLANNLSQEDMLSKLSELLATLIRWMLKTLLAVVIGIGTIQSLITPAVDQVKRSSIIKATQMIPGIGGLFSGVAETVLGAGSLLKNCIGVAGLVAIIVICAIPIVKLIIYVLIYKLVAAAIQPISDKRIVNCVSASAEASSLLLQTVFVAAILFEIVITIVAVSTMRVT